MKTKVTYVNMIVEITHDGKEVQNYSGDNVLISLLKNYFKDPIITRNQEIVDKIIGEASVELKYGDKGYIDTVLIDRVRPELGVELQ